LHILGDGKDKELLHQMKQDLGLENVIFHGVQKILILFSSLQIYLF
jgi:glycosyltransferase involved in cell wall biosynthesis